MSTATIAFVRSVIAASTAAGSRLSVRGSTSAKTGVAPSKMKQFAEETNESGEVIASSPGPSPAMRAQQVQPRGAARDGGREGCADALGDQLLEALDRRPEREPPGAQHLEHELFLPLVQQAARASGISRSAGAQASAGAGVA